ncbi:hypothetical protein D3C71_1565650 [compost metagenome]
MGLVAAVVVGAQQRADQQHRGAGGAGEAGQHGAGGQHAAIEQRRAVQVAVDVDAAGDGEQRHQQDDERHVLQHHGVQDVVADAGQAMVGRKRQHEGQCPAGGDLAEMVVPDGGSQQRHQGNA